MVGALVALVSLGILLYYINKNFPELNLFDDYPVLILLFVGVFGLGVVISWASTHFATQRFLNLRTDDLYY
jgi:cell division transport system permease protein